LDRFSMEAAARRLPVYAALSYQGDASLDPADPLDPEVIAAVNRHQRRDKGFGPALGPDAGARAVEAFERVGYRVLSGASDWIFGPEDRDIQLGVLAGWTQAATELDDLGAVALADWLARRNEWVGQGRSKIQIGHVD